MSKENMNSKNESENFFIKAQKYIEANKSKVKKYSTEDYFLMLLQKGLETRKLGNYGIAACLVVRNKGKEYIFFGKNDVVTNKNPHGHAEMNAVKNFRDFALSDEKKKSEIKKQGDILVRNAPSSDFEIFLVTTLEPCPMCTVGSVINSGIKKIIVGIEDEYGGALFENRLNKLAPIWKKLYEQLDVELIVSQSDNSKEKNSYVDQQLINLLASLFFENRDEIDKKLGENGFMDFATDANILFLILKDLE